MLVAVLGSLICTQNVLNYLPQLCVIRYIYTRIFQGNAMKYCTYVAGNFYLFVLGKNVLCGLFKLHHVRLS
jgi:hypothetical protein